MLAITKLEESDSMDTINKIFVLAGGNDQIELIRGLKKRFPHSEVILIDMNPNVRAKEFADRMLVISTMDYSKVLEAARREEIDLILSACGDQPLRTMAYVSEQMGLPCYLTYEQSENLTNKVLMKQKMMEGEIPTSKYHRFNINSDIRIDGLEFPLVIKPADNNGSKGIIKVYSKEEFDEAINEARSYTLCGELIVEEFKEGEEYSIEAFISRGKPHIIFASKNIKVKNRNTFTICSNEYVSNLSNELEGKIKDIIVKIGETFGIDNVPLLIQMIVKDNDVSVIEFSARTGGGSKLFFIREMTGVNIIENLLDITFGEKPIIETHPSKDKAVIKYVYTNPGTFNGFDRVEELEKEGYISATYKYKPFGAKIASSRYSSDRPAGFLIKGKTEEELSKKISYINRHVKVLDESGRDIMRHDIFE